MKNLGNHRIKCFRKYYLCVNQVMTILKDNGNSEAIFNLNLITAFEVVVETSSDKNFLLRFNSDKREEVELEKGLSQTLILS